MEFCFKLDDDSLVKGIEVLKGYYDFSFSEVGKIIQSKKCENGLKVFADGKKITIEYESKAMFYMGFSYCMQNYHKDSYSIEKCGAIKNLGFMRDCARNAALSFEGFKDLAVYLALMGYNYIELYVEDLMDIEKYPYLGHSRPRYTKDDFKKMDEFAKIFGIELVPCIQTLAHLPNIFRHDMFAGINDIKDILLIGEEKTYEFIEEVIKWCGECFTSRRINVGLDEAHNMCLGKYREKHGYPDNLGSVFLSHLDRVVQICKKYNFKPSMWSDMLFRIGMQNFSGSSYLGIEDKHFQKDFIQNLPPDINLIFWDYNHMDEDFYDIIFEKHFELTHDVSFASGAWTWKGFAPFNTIAENNSLAAVRSAKKNNVNDFLVTAWGDNGAECSTYAALSTYLAVSENVYSKSADHAELNKRCLFLFGNSYDDFKNTENANRTHIHTIKDNKDINPCKYLLYNDPLIGIFDAHSYDELNTYFKRNTDEFRIMKKKNGRFSYLFETLYRLSELLQVKATLGKDMQKAYLENDKGSLESIFNKRIPLCLKRLTAFYEAFKYQWMKENRSVGFEVIDIRIGGLLFRLRQIKDVIKDYLFGKLERIEELEQKRLPISKRKQEGDDIIGNCYAVQATGSFL